MSESSALEDVVLRRLHALDQMYQRLVLLVGKGMGEVLHRLAERESLPLIELNLELSRRLLDLPQRERVLNASRLIGEIVAETESGAVLLDRIELLFEPSLALDPLRLLQGLSRSRALVVHWPGRIEEEHLVYARPGHPEHRRYATEGLVVVQALALPGV